MSYQGTRGWLKGVEGRFIRGRDGLKGALKGE